MSSTQQDDTIKTRTKRCPRCGQVKDVDTDFYKRPGKEKWSSYCKKCNNEKTNEWRHANRERWNASVRAWLHNNPDNAHIIYENYAISKQNKALSSQDVA